MAVIRDELRTGLLVIFTSTVLAAALIYLEAPGLAGQRRIYRVYFDNANGINVGAPVMLAGRKVGQVARIFSPVPVSERPRQDLEAAVEVAVDAHALIYREEKVVMLQYSLLSEQVVDFAQGNEASGLAESRTNFIGERQPGLGEVGQKMMEKIDPVINDADVVMKELQTTTSHLSRITENGSDLVTALAQFRQVGEQLVALSGSDGAVRHTAENLERLTDDDGPLTRLLSNVEKFTGDLAGNKDVGVSLRNFRRASENLSSTTQGLKNSIGPGISRTVHNAEQFTDTVKRQPWRLIWPSTKHYPEDKPKNCPPKKPPCVPVCKP